MSMRKMEELRSVLCEELGKIADKGGNISAGDLEAAHKLTDTIKNIDKISMLEEADGYSQRYYRDGSSYDRGNSYTRRDGNGRYSRDSMMDHIDKMMSEANSDRERERIRRFRDEMSNA